MTSPGRRLTAVSGPHADQPLVTAGAPAMAAEVAVVACHGRGATAQGIVNLLEPVYRHGVAFLAPQATRNGWFRRPPTDAREANEPHLTSSVDCVAAALEAAGDIDVPPERTVIGGFSQGACVVAEFVRRNPRRYGGVFLLSGHLPGTEGDDRSVDGDLERTPMLVGCGEDDARIDPDRVSETARAFERANASVDERRYPGVGHEVTDDEFAAIGTMLENVDPIE